MYNTPTLKNYGVKTEDSGYPFILNPNPTLVPNNVAQITLHCPKPIRLNVTAKNAESNATNKLIRSMHKGTKRAINMDAKAKSKPNGLTSATNPPEKAPNAEPKTQPLCATKLQAKRREILQSAPFLKALMLTAKTSSVWEWERMARQVLDNGCTKGARAADIRKWRRFTINDAIRMERMDAPDPIILTAISCPAPAKTAKDIKIVQNGEIPVFIAKTP